MVERLIEAAEREIGVCEPKGEDKYIALYNAVGGMNFGMDVPWCAIFVTWCREKAGIDKSVIPTFASCDLGKDWFIKNGRWQPSRAFGGDYVPKRGDIIFYSSKYTPNDSTHVGIVTNVSGNAVSTIEGNASNKVARRSYSVASKYIIGYGVPEYEKNMRAYVVMRGDSLWKIAEKELGSGVRYKEIMALNNLEETTIYPGDKLYLPE